MDAEIARAILRLTDEPSWVLVKPANENESVE